MLKRSLTAAFLGSLLVARITCPAHADGHMFENEHYAVAITERTGGLIEALRCKSTDELLLSHMRIYTDYGVYDKRGYVGTGQNSAEQFERKDEAEGFAIIAGGKLVGEPAAGKSPIEYLVETRCDATPVIHVSATIKPQMDKKDVNGFLALCWAVPTMTRWRLRTIDGLLRYTLKPDEVQLGRSYDGDPPFDPVNPLIVAVTEKGTELRLENLRWSGVPHFSGPIIHGQTIFLCWMLGAPFRDLVAGQSSTLQFDLKVVPPPR
jgi:hypothetical protein